MFNILSILFLGVLVVISVEGASLGAYNVDPTLVSVSGLSAGGFMAVQLGVAYSNTFQVGFGVFAGGPFDCARAQSYTSCMYNQSPSITAPTANMKSWSGNQIDNVSNLKNRNIYMEVGSADTTVGPNVMAQLEAQLANFDASSKVTYVTTSGAAHTFPTDFDGSGDNACSSASSPYISNCGYDGAGAVLNWMYGSLAARNNGQSSGSILSFAQTVPTAVLEWTPLDTYTCHRPAKVDRQFIGYQFINNTGYNKWADTNNIIILYPQAVVDYTTHTIWSGTVLSNPNACFDWVGWYGSNADQIGGVQMVAITNAVNQIISGYKSGSGSPSSTGSTTLSTKTTSIQSKTTSTAAATTTAVAPLYGQCGGIGYTGPTTCMAPQVCVFLTLLYSQCEY